MKKIVLALLCLVFFQNNSWCYLLETYRFDPNDSSIIWYFQHYLTKPFPITPSGEPYQADYDLNWIKFNIYLDNTRIREL